MKIELLIITLTIFFIANTYYDGKYVKLIKSWKKYYQMAGIGFVGLSAYVFMKKYPSHTRSLFTDASKMVKYMPIDKEAGDLIQAKNESSTTLILTISKLHLTPNLQFRFNYLNF